MQQAFNHIQRAYFIQQQKLSEAIFYEVSKNKILKLISITKGRFPNAYSFHTLREKYFFLDFSVELNNFRSRPYITYALLNWVKA